MAPAPGTAGAAPAGRRCRRWAKSGPAKPTLSRAGGSAGTALGQAVRVAEPLAVPSVLRGLGGPAVPR